MFTVDKTALLIIDVQGKLAQLMHDKKALFDNLGRIVRGVKTLEIPILWAEQNPEGLGPTIPAIAEQLPELDPIAKTSFSCCGSEDFIEALSWVSRKQILVVGIEAHVCVYQTVMDLLERGYEVQVVADAVSSRTLENKKIGLKKMTGAGAGITSVETALFEILRVAKGEKFKEILKIVK